MSNRRNTLAILATIVVIGAILVPAFNYRMQKSQQRGDQIIAALKSYKAAKGTYPGDLSDLVPHYLPAIPQPSARIDWDYIPFNRATGFILSFDGEPIPSLGRHYTTEDSRWHAHPN